MKFELRQTCDIPEGTFVLQFLLIASFSCKDIENLRKCCNLKCWKVQLEKILKIFAIFGEKNTYVFHADDTSST